MNKIKIKKEVIRELELLDLVNPGFALDSYMCRGKTELASEL
jgi:hypothetical protein